MESIQFLVQGSAKDPYELTFSRDGNVVTATCTCRAGDNGTYCKHRQTIFDGKGAGVVSENQQQVATVASWWPNSNLAAHYSEIIAAENNLKRAEQDLGKAKKKFFVAVNGKELLLSESVRTRPPADYVPPIENESRKRLPLKWVAFSDILGDIDGYAKGWFFWVHKALKPALDIAHVEVIDKKKTSALRDKMSLQLFGVTHEDLKKQISASGEALGDSVEHKQIMAYSHKDLIETEGSPLLFAFRETDSVESRSGEWYIQVSQATPATEQKSGSVGFDLFVRNHDNEVLAGENPKGVWNRKAWFSTTQRDFVELLKTGRCSVIDLDNPIFDPEVDHDES